MIVQRDGTKDYKSRLDVIRNPKLNHMSRTRSKVDRGSTGGRSESGRSPMRKKKKNFAGAYVAEPRRQVSSGFSIGGNFLAHIHNFVIDMDLASLYPSIMLLLNLSPKTFAGKFMLRGHWEIPMYPWIKFLDKEEAAEYKKNNANDFFMECYQGKHWWALMEIFFNMRSTEEIMDYIEEHIEDFKAA